MTDQKSIIALLGDFFSFFLFITALVQHEVIGEYKQFSRK